MELMLFVGLPVLGWCLSLLAWSRRPAQRRSEVASIFVSLAQIGAALALVLAVLLMASAILASGGIYAGAAGYLLVFPAAAALAVAGLLGLAGGRGSRPTELLAAGSVALVVLSVLGFIGSMQVAVARQESAAVAASAALDAASRDCARQAVQAVPELPDQPNTRSGSTTENALHQSMVDCIKQRKGSIESSGWMLQCHSSCRVDPPHSRVSEDDTPRGPLMVFTSEYLNEALQSAGRPDWSRFQSPGSQPVRPPAVRGWGS